MQNGNGLSLKAAGSFKQCLALAFPAIQCLLLWKTYFLQGFTDDSLLHYSQLHELLTNTGHVKKAIKLKVGERKEIRKSGVKAEVMILHSLLVLELSNRRDFQSAVSKSRDVHLQSALTGCH